MDEYSGAPLKQQKHLLQLLGLVLALLVIGLVATLPPGHVKANENRDQDLLIAHMMNHRGIGRIEAEKRLLWQDQASALLDELEEKLPRDHGAVWIGKDDDRVKVGIVSSKRDKSEPLTTSKVRDLSLETAVDYVSVDYAFADLELVADALTGMSQWYDERNGEWQISVGIVPSLNKVLLSLPPEYIALTGEQQQFVNTAKEKFKGMIATDHYTGMPQEDACNDKYCTRPLRGGVQINSSDGYGCTVGFIVRGKATGNRYVLTAGHCSQSNGVGTKGIVWSSREAGSSTNRTIGPVTENYYRQNGVDAMIIRVRNDLGWNWSSRGWIYLRAGTAIVPFAPPSRNEAWHINGHSSNGGLENQRVCVAGAFYTQNGTVMSSCGPIREVNVSRTLGGVTTTGLVRAGYCSVLGDSGAPVVRGNSTHHALGIHRGNAGSGSCNEWKYYTGMTATINHMGGIIEMVKN